MAQQHLLGKTARGKGGFGLAMLFKVAPFRSLHRPKAILKVDQLLGPEEQKNVAFGGFSGWVCNGLDDRGAAEQQKLNLGYYQHH